MKSITEQKNPYRTSISHTVKFKQSKSFSLFLWSLLQESRWYYNKGVRLAFDNRKLSQFDMFAILTKIRHSTEWSKTLQEMQKAWIDGGRKAIRLHQKKIDDKNKE